MAAQIRNADARAADLLPVIDDIRAESAVSLRQTPVAERRAASGEHAADELDGNGPFGTCSARIGSGDAIWRPIRTRSVRTVTAQSGFRSCCSISCMSEEFGATSVDNRRTN